MTMVEQRPTDSYAAARRAMVDCQLRVSGVNEDWVLSAMGQTPREDFVPAKAKALAYIDRAVPLGAGRFMAAPLFYGRLLSAAAPNGDDKVLIVDGGSSYLPALVEKLAGSVEVVDPASAIAKSRKRGDFSLLLIDGAIEELPTPLAARLAEGGRVVTGLVSRGVTRLATGRKVGSDTTLISLAEMGVPILPEFAVVKSWSF